MKTLSARVNYSLCLWITDVEVFLKGNWVLYPRHYCNKGTMLINSQVSQIPLHASTTPDDFCPNTNS